MPDPLAAVRRACAGVGDGLPSTSPVVVACSGGADSLALLDACVWSLAGSGHPVVGATVDHGLQLPRQTLQLALHVLDALLKTKTRRLSTGTGTGTWSVVTVFV